MDEYKRLDKCLKDAYDSKTGVTNYIEEMCSKPEGKNTVPDWDFDLEQLCRMRRIRNKISHEVGAYEEDLCNRTDILWLEDFYNRLMREKDPLALLRKNRKVTVKRIVHHKKEKASLKIIFAAIVGSIAFFALVFLAIIYFLFY